VRKIIKIKKLLLTMPLLAWLTACAQTGKPQADRELRGMGIVVMYALAPGVSNKEGVQAITDAGNQMFASSILNPKNGGVSSVGGGSNMSFPRWVRVTWRKGPGIDMDFKNGGWTGGTVAGDYAVEVLSRIPDEVFTYATAARGRAIVLRFRLKDDGVLLAWDVQESSPNGQGWLYKMHGGDF
jgi:hypothetical protein